MALQSSSPAGQGWSWQMGAGDASASEKHAKPVPRSTLQIPWSWCNFSENSKCKDSNAMYISGADQGFAQRVNAFSYKTERATVENSVLIPTLTSLSTLL